MVTLQEIRDFLERYHERDAYPDPSAVPKLGEQPSDWIRNRQQTAIGTSDEHVIPASDFQFRIHGEDKDLKRSPRFVKSEKAIGAIENAWDRLIEDYGLDAVSSYIPFHEDFDTYGIYIQQRGIRFLGHLLYQWSRVGSLVDTQEEAIDLLMDDDFQESDQLFRGTPQFASVEDAFELAQEILLRHQWFHHQFELLAAYAEDSAETLYYPEYHQHHLTISKMGSSPEQALATAYVIRSQACANKSPPGLFQPLLWRAVAGRGFNRPSARDFTNDFAGSCFEVSAYLVDPAASGTSQRGIGLARELPFDTAIVAVVPSKISVFITRQESDPNNASYARNEHPLGQKYTICRTNNWTEAYEDADQNIKDLVETIEEKAKNRPQQLDQRGRGEGPKNRFYGYLNGGARRFVYEINHREQHVDLLDFGDHETPEQYGLYKG